MMNQPFQSIIRHLPYLKLHNHLVSYQAPPEELVADAVELKEGVLADNGALVIDTGRFTGRSPKDKYITLDGITRETVTWGDVNNPLDYKYYEYLNKYLCEYLSTRKIWVRDAFVCADPQYRMNLRIITETVSFSVGRRGIY